MNQALVFQRSSAAGIELWQGGAGPDLLYLHGGGASDLFRDSTAPFLVELARRFRVVVPEHPGFGHAERPAWLDNIHDLAYFYLDFLRERGARELHLLGHGIGGWIALELAVRSTARLSRLTVAGCAGIRVAGIARGDLFLWSPEQAAENLLQDPAARAHHLAMLGRDMSAEDRRESLRNRETLALLAWEPRLYDPDLEKWLHRIDVPTHVIWAQDDRLLSLPHGEAIAAAIPGTRLSVVPESRHLMQFDQPARFAALVAEHAPVTA
jgi:pimeloyl-ACP methyl ester carboxylesterase